MWLCPECAPFSLKKIFAPHTAMYELENCVISDVLCFLLTSEESMTKDDIVTVAVGFYSSEKIKKAKELFFQICKERLVTRKACTSHPNPSVPDVEDILSLHEKVVGKKFLLPRFLAERYSSLPPSSGFLPLASMLCSLREEMVTLKEEVSQLRQNNTRDLRSLEDVNSVKQDIADIKICLQNSSSGTGQATSYASTLMSSQPNGSQHPSSNFSRNSSSQPVQIRGQNQRNLPTINPQSAPPSSSSNRGVSLAPPPTVPRPNARPKRNSNVFGTAPAGSSGLLSASRVLDVFVGGCSLECDATGLKTYCESSGIEVKACVSLESRSEWSKSFKISVDLANRNKLLEPEFWPNGIFVRKFYKPRSPRTD